MKKLINAAGKNPGLVISALIVFVGICVFFIVVNPIIPYDGDDWLFYSHFRSAVPSKAYWNAGRIFQDILFPFLGFISAFIVSPITGNYLFSFAITIALVLALSVTIFHVSLYRLFLAIVKNRAIAITGCFLMLVLYFVFFKTKYESTYMLHGLNFTCVICYTIPGLLNSILVCVLLRYHVKGIAVTPKNIGVLKFGFLVLFSYLAVFTILFESIILTVFCFFYVVYSCLKDKKPDLKKTVYHLCVIAAFIVYCIFEITSARAATDTVNTFALNQSTGFFARILISVQTSYILLSQINAVFMIFFVAIMGAAITVFVVKILGGLKPQFFECLIFTIIAALSLYLANVIVSAQAGALFYPQFLQVMYGVFFYLFLGMSLSVCFLLKDFRWMIVIVPLAIFIFSNELLNSNNRYTGQLSYHWVEGQLPVSKKMELTNNWIDVMRRADRNGESEVTLYVPDYPNRDDFPHPAGYWGTAFSGALFAHRITARYITVKLEYVDGILRKNSFENDWQ